MPKPITSEKKAELEHKLADAKSAIDDIEKDFNQSFANASIAKKAQLLGLKVVLAPFILAARNLLKYAIKKVPELEVKDGVAD